MFNNFIEYFISFYLYWHFLIFIAYIILRKLLKIQCMITMLSLISSSRIREILVFDGRLSLCCEVSCLIIYCFSRIMYWNTFNLYFTMNLRIFWTVLNRLTSYASIGSLGIESIWFSHRWFATSLALGLSSGFLFSISRSKLMALELTLFIIYSGNCNYCSVI